jgi:hypothetical protein
MISFFRSGSQTTSSLGARILYQDSQGGILDRVTRTRRDNKTTTSTIPMLAVTRSQTSSLPSCFSGKHLQDRTGNDRSVSFFNGISVYEYSSGRETEIISAELAGN